jgi:cytochrome oxidase Cu insertion factor (SCO1/SenC/PrrC family)
MKEVKEMFTVRVPNDAAPRAAATGAAWLFLLCALLSPQALAQHSHVHDQHAADPHPPRAGEAPRAASSKRPGVIEVGAARLEISDAEVLDQNGRRVRFYSDLIKGKVVVINFFFTSCTLVCPMQGRALARLQTQLAERLGEEVFFISVSRDPETDTPKRLRLWGKNFGVGRGWTLVTGKEGVMAKLVRDFTGAGLGGQMHAPILLIGNDRTGVWTQAEGLSPAQELVKIIDEVSDPAGSAAR